MMLEQLLSSGLGVQNYYPDSGPGNKTLLKGDLQAGYFGIIPASQMFAVGQLALNLGLNATGTTTSSGASWFKFAYKGKFIFIACMQDRVNLTWNDLYNAGAVYGTKDNGTYPVGAGVYQYRPQRVVEGARSWFLVPRLPRVAAADPANLSAPITDQNDCEWYQLFRRIMSNTGGPANPWYLASAAEVFYSGFIGDWMLNTVGEDITKAVMVGTGSNGSIQTVTSRVKNTVGVNPFWRPVLELIPSNSPIDPWNVRDQSYGTIPPAITTQYVSTPGLLSIKNVISVWPTKQPVISSWSFPLAVFNPIKPQGSANLGLNPFAVSGDGANLANNPRNLTYKSTNLNPFSVVGSNIA